MSQVLAYAAFLHGLDVAGLQQGPLRRHLEKADYGSILEAVQAQDQEGAVDVEAFSASMQEFLDQGNFRLVLVLDEVSAELERVIAYLDAITVQALTIDLITLKVYEVNGAQVALPQRVSPDIGATIPVAATGRGRPAASKGMLSDGPDAFRASVEGASEEAHATFDELIAWAERIASLPNVRLFSYSGTKFHTLLPRIMPGNAGLVTIWNDNQRPYITVYRSVFGWGAPNSIEAVERAIAPVTLGKGKIVSNITPHVLEALTAAYRETGRG